MSLVSMTAPLSMMSAPVPPAVPSMFRVIPGAPDAEALMLPVDVMCSVLWNAYGPGSGVGNTLPPLTSHVDEMTHSVAVSLSAKGHAAELRNGVIGATFVFAVGPELEFAGSGSDFGTAGGPFAGSVGGPLEPFCDAGAAAGVRPTDESADATTCQASALVARTWSWAVPVT